MSSMPLLHKFSLAKNGSTMQKEGSAKQKRLCLYAVVAIVVVTVIAVAVFGFSVTSTNKSAAKLKASSSTG